MTDNEADNYRDKIDDYANRLWEVLHANSWDKQPDWRAGHMKADDAMCQFFIDIGKPEIAMAFYNVGKRYA